MFTFLSEVNLWSFDDNIVIRDADFGAFCYHDKRTDNIYEEGKKSYSQKRGMVYAPNNKKGNKLKDSIKYLEEHLRDNTIIYCRWQDEYIVQLILSNALIIYIQINTATGDVQKIVFDKYLIGKLPEHISDVTVTRNHVLCTYNDNQVALVYFLKSKKHIFDKISKLEPKLLITELSGPHTRRLDKKVQLNKSGDMAIIWWKSTMNEVYPWSPVVKEHDRANIHLYRIIGYHDIKLTNLLITINIISLVSCRIKLELLCYIRSEFDPLCIMFNTSHDSIIHSVEQKVSRKGEVTIEWHTYEVSQQDKLQRIAMISVPLPTHTSCIQFSPSQDLLLLCCIDGSVIIYDQIRAITVTVKAAFIPTIASWHNDGIVFVIGNDRGQFQYFDISLSCIKNQTLNEEATASNILDLSSYFRTQPALLRMDWNKKVDRNCYIDVYDHGNAFLLLLFQRGPMGVIRLIEGNDLSGGTIIRKYLALSQIEHATSLLLAMNWDTHSRCCMHSLNQILNYLFKLPLTFERENLIQNALGSFHVPVKPIRQSVAEEYGDEIRDLTRRFFYHLLRYQMFEKAFRLAIDLNDHDLFMDLHFYALVVNDMAMADAAREKAERIISRSNSCSSTHSLCSRTSCSLCSDSGSDKREDSCNEDNEHDLKESRPNLQSYSERDSLKDINSQIPPLPVLHSHHSTKNLFSMTYSSVSPSNKNDCNLVSTSFTMPTVALHANSTNHSSQLLPPDNFFASTAFNKPNDRVACTNLTVSTMSSTHSMSLRKRISDDLMSTSFGCLSLNDTKLISPSRHSEILVGHCINKSFTNDLQFPSNNVVHEKVVTTLDRSSVLSSPFVSSTYNSIHMDSPAHLLTYSDSANGNLMSTSFSAKVTEPLISYHNPLGDTTLNTNTENASISTKTTKSYSTDDFLCKTFSDSVITDKLTRTFHNTSNNLMSTSFNFNDDQIVDPRNNSGRTVSNDNQEKSDQNLHDKKHIDLDIPPPPSLTHVFSHSFQNLSQKSYSLSLSTPGLLNVDEAGQRSAKMQPNSPHFLHKQYPNPSNLHNQQQYLNVKPRSYRLNYDFDHVPFYKSCGNIDVQSNSNNTKHNTLYVHSNYSPQETHTRQVRTSQYSSTNLSINKDSKALSNIPPLPVITTTTNVKMCPTFVDIPLIHNEKPKVKFSDTVTHILVPGMNQAHKQKKSTISQIYKTDPKRELAESLPLCLGNEDYLKDFQPLTRDNLDEKNSKEPVKLEEGSKIKVVHFGLL